MQEWTNIQLWEQMHTFYTLPTSQLSLSSSLSMKKCLACWYYGGPCGNPLWKNHGTGHMHGQILTVPKMMNHPTMTSILRIAFPTQCGVPGPIMTTKACSLEWLAIHSTWVDLYACLLFIHQALSIWKSTHQPVGLCPSIHETLLGGSKRTILMPNLAHHCSQPGSHHQSPWSINSARFPHIQLHQLTGLQPCLLSLSCTL